MEGYGVSRIFIPGMVIIAVILSVQIILIIISSCIVQGTEKRNKFSAVKILLFQLISKIVVFRRTIIIMRQIVGSVRYEVDALYESNILMELILSASMRRFRFVFNTSVIPPNITIFKTRMKGRVFKHLTTFRRLLVVSSSYRNMAAIAII